MELMGESGFIHLDPLLRNFCSFFFGGVRIKYNIMTKHNGKFHECAWFLFVYSRSNLGC